MISLFAFILLSQIKEGDAVYVKPPGATAWKTASLAASRYKDPTSYDAPLDLNNLPKRFTTYKEKREKLSVLSVEDYDGEKIVRVKDQNGQPWWMISTDLAKLDETGQASVNRDEIADKLRPFCITKPEHTALTVAVGKGLDPLTMTAEQAQALSPSQRKALSSIKARYLKAKKR